MLVDLLEDIKTGVCVTENLPELFHVSGTDLIGRFVFAKQTMKDVGTEGANEVVHLIAALVDKDLFVSPMKSRLKHLVRDFVLEPFDTKVEVPTEIANMIVDVAIDAPLNVLVVDALAMYRTNKTRKFAVLVEDKLDVSVDVSRFGKTLAVVEFVGGPWGFRTVGP